MSLNLNIPFINGCKESWHLDCYHIINIITFKYVQVSCYLFAFVWQQKSWWQFLTYMSTSRQCFGCALSVTLLPCIFDDVSILAMSAIQVLVYSTFFWGYTLATNLSISSSRVGVSLPPKSNGVNVQCHHILGKQLTMRWTFTRLECITQKCVCVFVCLFVCTFCNK